MHDQQPDQFEPSTPENIATRVQTVHPFNKQNLLDFKGRMNRLDFCILMFSIMLFVALLFKYLGINPVSSSAIAATNPDSLPDDIKTIILLNQIATGLFAFIAIKRLHDIDYSGWLAIVFIVHFLIGGIIAGLAILVGFILRLILMFAPGIATKNRYGDLPAGNNRKKIIVLVVVLVLLFNIYGGFIEEAQPYIDQLRDYILEQQQ